MRTNTVFIRILLACCAVCAGACTPRQPAELRDARAAMSADAVRRVWLRESTPGEGHQRLQALAGVWDARAMFWMEPGGEAQISNGRSSFDWTLGGRFLRQEYQGTMRGQPFTGIGIIGYDNITSHYQSTWMDSMSTAMMQSTGLYDPSSRTIIFNGEYPEMLTGKMQRVRSVLSFLGPDQNRFEMFEPDRSGRQFKSLEILYTRVLPRK